MPYLQPPSEVKGTSPVSSSAEPVDIPITTKGDLLTFSSLSSDITRLPVGSNNQILQANSLLDSGLEWKDKTHEVVYSGTFPAQLKILYDGSATDGFQIAYDPSFSQFKFYRVNASGWIDAGIIHMSGNTVFVNHDDIYTNSGTWYFFTNDGIHDTTFNMQSYGRFSIMHIVSEGYSSIPAFLIYGGCGNTGSLWAHIIKMEPK